MLGVGGGTEQQHAMLLAGMAGLVGGALSMAVGEYISVASQVRQCAPQFSSVGRMRPLLWRHEIDNTRYVAVDFRTFRLASCRGW